MSLTATGNRATAKFLSTGIAILLLIALRAGAQDKLVTIAERAEKLAGEQFAATNCPGMSVAVASKGEIVFSQAYGMADVEQGVALSTDSAHRLASISKPITATVIADLVEQGKLGLDVSVRRYLPELPNSYQNVTVRHLLTHQSGVKGYTDLANVAFSVTHYAKSRDALESFMAHPLMFEPGTKTEYSSLAFTVVGAVAEAITGRTFQQVALDFFAEYGIEGFSIDDPLAIVPKRVRDYLVDHPTSVITNARFYDVSNRYPAAGFTSSAENLLRFVTALGTGGILKPETVKQLWTASTTSQGAASVFGLGWGVSEWKGRAMVGMNGAGPGTTTFLHYFPESSSGVALLCNAEGARDLPKLLDDLIAAAIE